MSPSCSGSKMVLCHFSTSGSLVRPLEHGLNPASTSQACLGTDKAGKGRTGVVGEAPGSVKSEFAQIRHAGSLLGHSVCLLSLPTLCSVPSLFLLHGRHTSPEAPSHFIALRFCSLPPTSFPSPTPHLSFEQSHFHTSVLLCLFSLTSSVPTIW